MMSLEKHVELVNNGKDNESVFSIVDTPPDVWLLPGKYAK